MAQDWPINQWAKIANFGPQTINSIAGIAYGSRITDKYGSESDYDLAVIIPAMPNKEEIRWAKRILEEKTGLSIDLFFASPAGIQARKTMDPMIHSLLKTGQLLWGELGDWWNLEPFAADGVEDALITVESLTDTGDFTDLTPGIAEYSWRLLDGAWAAWRGEKLGKRKRLPLPEEMSRSIANLRNTIRNNLQGGTVK